MTRLLRIFLLMFAVAGAVHAGDDRIALGWQPVDGAVHYRVVYSPVSSGEQPQIFETEDDATSLSLPVSEATRYWACAIAVDGEGNESPECSHVVYGWAAPRITGVTAGEAAYDPATDRNRITLEIAGFNFRQNGSVLVDRTQVDVVERQWVSTHQLTVTFSVDASVTSLNDLGLRVYNKDESEPGCSLATGNGCVFGEIVLDIDQSTVAGGIFSTAGNPYTSSGRLFHQIAYVIPSAGESIERFSGTFLSGSVGLNALDLAPDGAMLFGVDGVRTVSHQGQTIRLRPNTIYRMEDDGPIEPFFDFSDAGLSLSDFGALKVMDDGSYLFAPAETEWVSFDGGLLRLAAAMVYRFDPEQDQLEEFFDAGRLGMAAIDGVDVLHDNRIALSTVGNPFVTSATGLTRLWDANIYAIDDADNIELQFQGSSFGLDDLDALSLGSHVEFDVRVVVEPPPPPPRDVLILSSATNHYAGTKRVFDGSLYAAATDSNTIENYGPSFTGNVGLDALDIQLDGSAIFSVADTGYASHAGGVMQLFDSNLYRRTSDGTISPFLSWGDFGLSPGNVDALDVLDDGSVVFSTDSNKTVFVAGQPMTLRSASAYRIDPSAGTLAIYFDSSSLGIPDLDAIQIVEEGTVFSTATSPWISTPDGLLRLWGANAYLHDSRTGALDLWFDGSDRGLDDLDALSLRDPDTDDGF